MLREVPPRLRQALSRELEVDLSTVEENMRRKATACVKALITDAFREFRESASGTRAGPSSAPNEGYEVSGAVEEGFWLPGMGFDFLDVSAMLGGEEIGYDQGCLLDNIMQGEDIQHDQQPGSAKKSSGLGYVSKSPDGSQETADASFGNTGTW